MCNMYIYTYKIRHFLINVCIFEYIHVNDHIHILHIQINIITIVNINIYILYL
jgi:hypothetical protein